MAIILEMSEVLPQKVLLFISHQPDNLRVATSFLKKRNFVVHVESDVKDAIVQVFDLKPDFVFISWDHTDKKIQMLPKILAQSTASIIVPFINRNTKDAIFKIEQCPYTPKLYPPLSGPSVERLIMKSSKEDADYLEKVKKFKSAESKAEMAQIQKNLEATEAAEAADAANAAAVTATATANATANAAASAAAPTTPPAAPEGSESETAPEAITASDKVLTPQSPQLSEVEIQKNIAARNDTLEKEKEPLSEAQKLEMQKTINEDIKPSLENVLTANEAAHNEIAQNEKLAPAKKPQRKGTLVFKDTASTGQKKSNIYISKGTPIKKQAKAPSAAATEEPVKGQAASANEESLKKQAASAEPEENTVADRQMPSMNHYVHCISIVCPAWCGYFMIASTAALDFQTIELVFSDWLKTQMKNLDDITERDYFNFDDVPDETITEIKKMADYSEVIQVHDQEFSIFFFAVEPKDMKIDFSPDQNYIEVYTRDIPPQATLSFDLLLHLPENQKYLLFTMKDMAITEDQRSRLLNRNVTKLFTKIENEYEYRRFLVMKTFSRLFEVISSRLAGQ